MAVALPNPGGDYGSFVNNLRNPEVDPLSAINNLNIDEGGKSRIRSLYNEIKQQQSAGAADYWYKGNLASRDAAAAEFALRLAENGLSSLRDLGKREESLDLGEDGGLQNNIYYINKQTGELLPHPEKISGRGGRGLDIDYNLHFTDDGFAIPYTSNRTSSWVSFRDSALRPIAGIVLAAYGVPYVAGAIAGTTIGGVTLTAGSALTTGVASGLVSGGASLISGNSFEDALKSALTSGLTAGASAGYADTIGQSLGFDAGSVAAKAAGNAIIAAAKAGITDENILQNMAIAAVGTYMANKEPAFDATEREGSLAKIVDDDTMTTDFSVNADYSLTSNLTFPSTEGINVDDRGVGEGYDLTGGTTPFTGLQTSTSPNLAAMGGGQGLTATKSDGSTLAGKDFTTGPTLKDAETAVKVGGVLMAGNEVIDQTIGLGGSTVANQRRDIYRDAPLAGFKMVKYDDPATGGSKYIPFVGEEALLPPPTGYTRATYAKGGFVTRR